MRVLILGGGVVEASVRDPPNAKLMLPVTAPLKLAALKPSSSVNTGPVEKRP